MNDDQYKVLLALNRNEKTRPGREGLPATMIGLACGYKYSTLTPGQQWASARLRTLAKRHLVINLGDGWRSLWRITHEGVRALAAETEQDKK